MDHGEETILAVREKVAPELDPQLLRGCYAIQRNYQFERDRSQPVQALERLIDGWIDAAASKEKQAGIA